MIQPTSFRNLLFAFLFACFFGFPALLAYVCRDTLIGSTKRLPIHIPFAIFVAPLLIFSSLSLLFPDVPKINDADLIPETTILPPEEINAYFPLQRASERIYTPEQDSAERLWQFLKGDGWDQAEIDIFLAANEIVLHDTHHAATLPRYECPVREEYGIDRDFACNPILRNIRQSALIAGLSALSHARADNVYGAVEDAFIPIRIGQLMIDQHQTSLIEYMVGITLQGIGFDVLRTTIKTYEIPSEILISASEELQQYVDNIQQSKNVMRHEYLWAKDAMGFIYNFGSNFYAQPNRSVFEVAKNARQNIALADTPCHEPDRARTESHYDIFPEISVWKIPFTRNAIWKPFTSMMTESFTGLSNRVCEDYARAEQIRFELILHAYKYDHGIYPASQAELIPQYVIKPIVNPLTNSEYTFDSQTGETILPQ